MRALIAPITRAQVSDLIAELDGGHLPPSTVEVFQRFVVVSSTIWAGSVGDRLVCLWGLIPPTLLSDRAYLWLHTTEAANDHAFVFVRQSQIQMKKMLEEYPRIVGHCLIDADRSIRWLKWLGAKFGESDGKMIPFEIKRKE